MFEQQDAPWAETQWLRELSPEQYQVLRQKKTERPFSGEYVHTREPGIYRCAGCGLELFSSETKYESLSGWPSFWEPIAEDRVQTVLDTSYGLRRAEVVCAHCLSHLGHVYDDGPEPTRMRYSINSLALKLDKAN